MAAAELFLAMLAGYAACGLAFGILFLLRGVTRIDSAARGTSIGFRLLILPGTVALWPVLLHKWWRTEDPT